MNYIIEKLKTNICRVKHIKELLTIVSNILLDNVKQLELLCMNKLNKYNTLMDCATTNNL